MEEQQLSDDSHYEISLTATQAFVAFVLLLLSLAASFAFGVMVGRGQLDPEAAKRASEAETTQIMERPIATIPAETATETVSEATAPDTTTQAGDEIEISSRAPAAATQSAPAEAVPAPATVKPAMPVTPSLAPAASRGPVYAQLLASGDAKRAETLAAKLIDAGFTTAFVDRVKSDKGTIHRVRVRFDSDADARAAVPKLQPYTTEKVLVTTK